MNIVYLCNYMAKDIIEQRSNSNTFAQAANNKVKQIKSSLLYNDYSVNVLSTGIVNNRSLKFYKGFKSNEEKNLLYSSIIDIPFINTLSSIFFSYIKIKNLHKEKKIDYIIFWNYKPEVALIALMCKKLLNIDIIIDYEDGYFALDSLAKHKKFIFSKVEKLVSPFLDGAILISEKLTSRIGNTPYVVIKGLTNEEILNHKITTSQCKNQSNEKITLMYAGGLDNERGIDILLESLKYSDSNFELLVTGKGELAEMVNNFNDSRINYLGFLSYEKTKSLMLSSDILINPQKEVQSFSQASFPSKIFDYLATNNLVVSSNIGNMKEFSENSFYIYENDNPEELAEKIDEAIADINSNNIVERLDKIGELKRYHSVKNVGEKLKTLFLK